MMVMIKFLVLSLVLISVNAGKELMIKECHKADFPSLCMQCLESNPASLRANSVGLAGIIMQCLDSNLHILTKYITEHIPIEKDETLKNILKDCKGNLTEASQVLNDGRRALKTGNLDIAGSSISRSVMIPVNCEADLQSSKLEYYQYYSKIIHIYDELSVAALRIIVRF